MKIAVLGGGNGGHAMAADMSLAGFDVTFYEVPEFRQGIESVIKSGEIELSGASRTGVAKLKKATTDIKEAVEGAKVINIVTPAFAHEAFYSKLAPHLEDGQIVVTHTGNYGSLQFAHKLKTMGVDKDVVISETQILLYACRRTGPGKVSVNGLKSTVLFSALPATDTEKALKVVNELFPQFVPGKNVLETSLDNLNFVFHPAIMILNAGRVEATKGDFLFYVEGATPSVCKVIEEIDGERIAVEKAFGFKPYTAQEWIRKVYGSEGESLYEVLQNTIPYHDRTCESAPSSLTYRYVTEDVLFGLIPLSSFGALLNIPTPTAKTLIHMASLLNRRDYLSEGLNVEKMGLSGKTVDQIIDTIS